MEVFIKILETQGFAILFGVAVMFFVYKHTPKFLSVWTEFTRAITANTDKMDSVVVEMARFSERNMSVLERLRELNDQLDRHSADAIEIKQNQAVMLKILDDIVVKISGGTKNE